MTGSSASDLADGSDWGAAWIDNLLHGTAMPDALTHHFGQIDALNAGLRQALEVYSLAMLTLAALLLFYYLAYFAVQTAQTGVPFGKRADAVWAPLRLVIAIGLLFPVSGGLSSGQFIVAKIAENGSRMAGDAWQSILQNLNINNLGLVTPHTPPLSGFVTAATEMELCRQIYEQYYAPLQSDPQARLAGHMIDALKIPATRLSGEVWRTSNGLNAAMPLCGEYRFSGNRQTTTLPGADKGDQTARLAASLGDFARTQTDALIALAQSTATLEMPFFAAGSLPNWTTVQNNLAFTDTNLRNNITAQLRQTRMLAQDLWQPLFSQANNGGWIAAGLFIPEIVRAQQSYGELVSTSLPTVQEPILAHPALVQAALANGLMQNSQSPEADKLKVLYSETSRMVSMIHTWLYSKSAGDSSNSYAQPSNFDLADSVTYATSSEATFDIFVHAIDTAAVAQGVWGVPSTTGDAGYPFTMMSSSASYNPLTMVVEFGRRQYQLGLYMIGLAGQVVMMPNAMAAAGFSGLGGICFILGASLLVFVLPFMIFFRFMAAVVTWIINFFEAIVAIPIVALAHMTPIGEGLGGSLARQSYLLWLGLWARPVLTLLGFVGGALFFNFALAILIVALAPFAQMSSTSNSGILITANTALVLLFDLLVYALANMCFKAILFLPDQALRWIAPFVVTEGNNDRSSHTSVNVPPGDGGTSQHTILSGASNLLIGIRDGIVPSMTNANHSYREKTAAKENAAKDPAALAVAPSSTKPDIAAALPQRDQPIVSPPSVIVQDKNKPKPLKKDPAEPDPSRKDAFFTEIKPKD